MRGHKRLCSIVAFVATLHTTAAFDAIDFDLPDHGWTIEGLPYGIYIYQTKEKCLSHGVFVFVMSWLCLYIVPANHLLNHLSDELEILL